MIPAAPTAYHRLLGRGHNDLDPSVFASAPLGQIAGARRQRAHAFGADLRRRQCRMRAISTCRTLSARRRDRLMLAAKPPDASVWPTSVTDLVGIGLQPGRQCRQARHSRPSASAAAPEAKTRSSSTTGAASVQPLRQIVGTLRHGRVRPQVGTGRGVWVEAARVCRSHGGARTDPRQSAHSQSCGDRLTSRLRYSWPAAAPRSAAR